MSDTKREIIELLARQERSAQGLAEALGMTPAGVRLHVAALEAQGLVTHRKQGGEPNRPTYVYRLSEQGEDSFPRRDDLLAESLVHRVLVELGKDGALPLIEHAGSGMAERLGLTRPGDLTLDQRQAVLGKLERELAWTADTQVEASGAVGLTLYQCPFLSISRENPDICPVLFTGLLRGAFGGGTVTCIAESGGDVCCRVTYAP